MTNKTLFNVKIIIIMLSSLFGVLACDSSSSKNRNANIFSITATTGMIADAAKNIAGDSAQVMALMGPGVDPHLYKATQGDIVKLNEADLILYNGLLLEGKMQEVLEKIARKKPAVAVAGNINKEKLILLEGHQSAPDPHVWFDVALWKEAVKNVSKAMQNADQKNAPYYQKNTEKYLERLDSLHAAVTEKIASIPLEQRVLITAHDAFNYFGRAYNIEVRGLQGISTLSEFGIRDVKDLVEFIVQRNIKAVFVESSVSPKALEAVVEGVKEKGHEIKIGGSLYSDAMGAAGTPEGTYIGMVHHNVQTITEALK